MTAQIGVDGCKGGWVACRVESKGLQFGIFATFEEIVFRFQTAIIAVDMPIGLPDKVGLGGRGPEGLIRPLLGQRKSSVFSIPSRAAVYAETYPDACNIAFATSEPPRKISKQGFFLFPKIREIDRLLKDKPNLRARIFESHPEMVFRNLKAAPLEHAKKTSEGANERTGLLKKFGFKIEHWPKIKGAAEDDIIDAAACLVTATRIFNGKAISFPAQPTRDCFDIPIAIWA